MTRNRLRLAIYAAAASPSRRWRANPGLKISLTLPVLPEGLTFKMVGVTPMLGRNDDNGTFDQSDARDRNACTGALFQGTNVAQAPFEFSRIFATFQG
jgi:hypothetical protein